jgi:ferredoxin
MLQLTLRIMIAIIYLRRLVGSGVGARRSLHMWCGKVCEMSGESEDVFEAEGLLVDRGICYGSGACAARFPDTFEVDHDGVVQIRLDASELTPEQAALAESDCPSGALKALASH